MQIFKNKIVGDIKFHEGINFYWGYILANRYRH